MLNNRRTRKATLALESLDDRVVPSAMNAKLAAHAQLQARLTLRHEQQMHILEAREARLQERMEARTAARAAAFANRHHFMMGPAVHFSARPHSATINHMILRLPNGAISGKSSFAGGSSTGSASSGGQSSTGSSSSSSIGTQNDGGSTSAEHSLPANVDQNLGKIYQEYQDYVSGGSSGTFTSSESVIIFIDGTNVGINAHGNGSGSFDAYVAALTGLGMQVQATDSNSLNVSGMIPISALPDAAKLSQTFSISPMYKPRFA